MYAAGVVTAIVLVKTDVARIPETAEAIAQIPEVSEVYSVTGEFDLVAMVRVRAHEELSGVIPGKLNKLPGVTHTETHIAFRTYSRHDLEAVFSLGYSESA
jgi:DNA-binding Lrp family transcriptional regulator